jgi:hypothetical protein
MMVIRIEIDVLDTLAIPVGAMRGVAPKDIEAPFGV